MEGDEMEKKGTRVSLKSSALGQSSTSYNVLVDESNGDTASVCSADDCGTSVDLAQYQDGSDEYILSKKRLILLNVAWLGIMITTMVLIIAAIPAQINFLVGPKHKTNTLALLAALCSTVVIVTAPTFGYLSDNCRSKYGRRRIYMVIGTILSCIGLALAALVVPLFSKSQGLLPTDQVKNGTDGCNVHKPRCPSSNLTDPRIALPTDINSGDVGLYILCIGVFFFGNTMMTTAYTGLIADKTHPSARGFSSGVVGVMMLTGNLIGAGLGMFADQIQVGGTFAVLAAICFISTSVTCATIQEAPTHTLPARKMQMSIKDLLWGYVSPFKSSDFRWVFITRFLLQMGLASSVGFLEYWLDDVVRLPACMSAMRAVSLLFIPFMVAGAVSSGVGGILTDRFQRRKIFVYVSGATMTTCCLILTFTRVYWLAALTMVILGLGYGAFVSVDLAMVFDVLPNAAERAKDLAVWHQALVLPQIIATPIAGIIVHAFQEVHIGSSGKLGCAYGLGYTILFGLTALYFLLSVLFVRKIKKVA
eukprot:scpid50511/ scgid30213/ 